MQPMGLHYSRKTWLHALSEKGMIPQDQLDSLLKEYSDLFHEELPAGLPPDRGIPMTIPLEEGTKPVKRPAF